MKKLKTLSISECVCYPALGTIIVFILCMIYVLSVKPEDSADVVAGVYSLLSLPFIFIHFFFLDMQPFVWDVANQRNPSLMNIQMIEFFEVWWSFLCYGTGFFMFYSTILLFFSKEKNSKKFLCFLWFLYCIFVWVLEASKQIQ